MTKPRAVLEWSLRSGFLNTLGTEPGVENLKTSPTVGPATIPGKFWTNR